MKSTALPIITIVLLLIFGCNTTDSNITKKVEHVIISSSETYTYRTGISGDEEGAQIIRQPNHYEISDIIRNETTNFEVVYRYKPATGFTGTDRVELKLSTKPAGNPPTPTRFETLTIEFTVE